MFEYYQNKDTGRWHWRLVAHNHETICSSQSVGHESEAGIKKGIESLISHVKNAISIPKQFEIWEDNHGRWHWNLTADNNEIVCHGQPHGFVSRASAKKGIQAVITLVQEILKSGLTVNMKEVDE